MGGGYSRSRCPCPPGCGQHTVDRWPRCATSADIGCRSAWAASPRTPWTKRSTLQHSQYIPSSLFTLRTESLSVTLPPSHTTTLFPGSREPETVVSRYYRLYSGRIWAPNQTPQAPSSNDRPRPGCKIPPPFPDQPTGLVYKQ